MVPQVDEMLAGGEWVRTGVCRIYKSFGSLWEALEMSCSWTARCVLFHPCIGS